MDSKWRGLTVSSCLMFLLVTLLTRNAQSKEPNGKVFACYYVPTTRIEISTIPANLCTHIIYAFAKVTRDGIVPEHGSDLTRYSSLMKLKQQNPALKVLLSLQEGFNTVVDSGEAVMQTFTKNSIAFLRKYGFDGIDFDWEFPSAEQKNNYMKLLYIFRKAINAEFEYRGLSPLKPLLISMALSNNRFIASRAYSIPSLNKYIDFATIMTYDFHVYNAKHDNLTGYNSPLIAPKGESQFASVSGMIGFYTSAGLEKSKVLMGVAAYGRTYILADPSKHGLHAPAIGKGDGGPIIHSKGVFITQEICMILKGGAHSVMDKYSGVPYLYLNKTWATYDNPASLQIKCSWAVETGLGGVGVWALTLDDTSNTCPDGRFPLLNTIKNCLRV